MRRISFFFLCFFLFLTTVKAQEEYPSAVFPVKAPQEETFSGVLLKSNILPWSIAIPNLGAEYLINKKWSLALDLWFCPWKISDSFSVKCAAILPEARWWLKNTGKGSFFNLHLNVAWFNVRANHIRYQDTSRPLLGGGIGYGYRLLINRHWGFEFEIGAGVANMKYNRFYNVKNGALIDTRTTTYFGIDRACISVTYFLCDL